METASNSQKTLAGAPSIIGRRKRMPAPVRSTPLPYNRPDLGDAEVEAAARVLRSGWLTSGPEVRDFETEFAELVGAPHVLALNSATAALHLAMVACNIGPEDAVLVPAMTFTASAEIIAYSGALPLVLDVDRESFLLSPDIVRAFIAKNCQARKGVLFHRPSGRIVRAMVPVHLGGRPCDLAELQNIANEFGLRLIEDAAHALPTRFQGRMIGSISEFTAFSFYATKNVTTAGEGGMLATTNADAAERLRRVRLHGIQGQTFGRARWSYDVVDVGYKYNLTDLAAAVGRVQLRRLPEFQARRMAIAAAYERACADLPLRLVDRPDPDTSVHLATVELRADAPLSRDALVDALYARNIATSLHFIPLYRFSFYAKNYELDPADFPNSEAIFQSILSLPLFTSMTDEDVADVTGALRDLLG